MRTRSRSLSTSARRAAATCSRSRTAVRASRWRADELGQPLVALREQQLLPAAQLAAQALIAAGLAGLALEGGALALELVDEVVDAGEVLLRRFELQLGLATARLELGDAGGLLDQLPAIGRLRAEDLADLALLDDGVALHADADVHQDVLHVAEADRVAVDQVLALAGAVEATADLDVPGDGRRLVDVLDGLAVGGRLAVEARQRRGLLGPGDHAAQVEPDLGRRGRLAGVAAAEDHVLHPVAAQALGTLLAEHPGDGVDDVALAAAVRADDGRHSRVEPHVGAIGKALETREFEAFEAHGAGSVTAAAYSGNRHRATTRCRATDQLAGSCQGRADEVARDPNGQISRPTARRAVGLSRQSVDLVGSWTSRSAA